MAEFLNQLVQTGALAVPNPMAAYQNALKAKAMQTQIRSAEVGIRGQQLDNETKLLEMGRGYLQMVGNLDDYDAFKEMMVKSGMNPRILPDFDSEEDFNDRFPAWREGALIAADTIYKSKMTGVEEAKKAAATLPYDLAKIEAKKKTPEEVAAEAKAKAEAELPYEKEKIAYREGLKAAKSPAELTRAALRGDKEAKAILDEMQKNKVEVARAMGEAQVGAKIGIVDVEGVAQSILDGRETIENVKNTFGVPVQEAVRASVLEKDPEFNFVKPRIKLSSIKTSLSQQQKQRGMMGSFVKNLNKQIDRIDEVMKDVISRVGIRAVDLPKRELIRRFKGSGYENVLEAYMLEISNEIGKLSTGSAASIRELSTDAQERWAKIHDPNLSLKELKKILDETRLMANMRIDSTDEEIEETLDMLDNVRKPRGDIKETEKEKPKRRFKILRVE